MKRTSRAQRRIDTKVLCNSRGFEKTKFDRQEQDIHTCPICNKPKEDRNHMFTCKGPSAVKNQEKNFTAFDKSVGRPQYITNVKENDHQKPQTRS